VFAPRHYWSLEAYRAFRQIGCRIKPSKDRRIGYVWGYRCYLNYPFDQENLLQLERIARDYNATLNRFDLALDIQPDNPENAKTIATCILTQLIMNWRRPGPMHDAEHGTYLVKILTGRKPPARNVVLYADRPNKVTGELDCVHLELRFLNAQSVRRQGIHRISDLIDLNPAKVMQKHVRWSNIGDTHVNEVIRRTVRVERQQYLKSLHNRKVLNGFVDKYRAFIPRKVQNLLERIGMDRAQRVKDVYADRQVKVLPAPLTIPDHLTWDTGRVGMEEVLLKSLAFSEMDGVGDALTLKT
jgi:hypothetical protein